MTMLSLGSLSQQDKFSFTGSNLIDQRVTNVFSRITAIILAALSVQYIVDGMTALNIVSMR